MRKILVFVCFIFSLESFGQLVGSIQTAIFTNEESSYVEIYTGIPSRDLQYKVDESGQFQASVEMLCLITQDSIMKVGEKFVLSSPWDVEKKDLWDVKRYALDPGSYNMSISLTDLENPLQAFEFNQELVVKDEAASLEIADIVLCANLGKAGDHVFDKYGFGFDILPYNLCTNVQNSLAVFGEVNVPSNFQPQDLAIQYKLLKGFDHLQEQEIALQGFEKFDPNKGNVFFRSMDIENLKSGAYYLDVALIDRERNIIHSKQKFLQIHHPDADLILDAYDNQIFEESFVQDLSDDDLEYALRAITPQVSQNNQQILSDLLDKGSDKAKRYFLYSYFSNQSLEHPDIVYNEYMKVAKAVDRTYRDNVGFGFETDRGYIFMKYGKPNDQVVVTDEPSAPPYEIWIYNRMDLTNQNDVKFLFYNPSLGGNNYLLLHSTCRGERNNPNWETELYGDALPEISNNRIDDRSVGNNYNRNARQFFSDF